MKNQRNNLKSHIVDVVSMGMNHPVLIRVITTVIVNVTNSKSLALRNVNVKIVLIPLADE